MSPRATDCSAAEPSLSASAAANLLPRRSSFACFPTESAFLVLARTRDREAARDLTQDVMLAVVRALRDGHLRDAERLAAFVYGTARNVINNYLRTRSRLPERGPARRRASSGEHARPGRKQRARRPGAAGALAALDSTDRKILLLTLVEGLKPGEIARPARPGIRGRANPKVPRPEENDRPREKTVTNMSGDATNSSKGRMDCDRVTREEILEGYLAGQVERGGPGRVRGALFRVRTLLR